ncbi:hypothetical protein BOX15_Mlig026584g3 [Macrostomum lignano]|uniref:Uncharacterized protein n=1 Tax=Macrostomum lignano TaxID=282301 RepID=A0A267G645_9PLAT|nr:hypothetical protein BOX15_Mlig026584g3 [Macrostomum lignano]
MLRRNCLRTSGRPVRPLSNCASKHAGSLGPWMSPPANATTCSKNGNNKKPSGSADFANDKSCGHLSDTTRFCLQTNNNKRERSAVAATSKSADSLSSLWLNQPVQESPTATPDIISNHLDDDESAVQSVDSEVTTRPTLTTERATLRTRLDLQTNNSRRERVWGVGSGSCGPASSSAAGEELCDDYEVVSELTEPISLENTSAVAKGSDAMVKNSLSRPTEIIDTSKLVEEGKVSTEYIDEPEIIEEQDRAMIDEYEKTFAYARRLRGLLNMKFKELDRGTVDTNFLLIKAHEHPTQRLIERWRNVDYGISYNEQVKRQKLIEDYRANAVKKKGKKGDEQEPVYPDQIRFTVRFRQENSEKRWKDYLNYRKNQKKLGGKKGSGPVPKPNDKYVFAFLDIWSYALVVFVKPSACVKDIINPVFARLGLEQRADFTYTVGCFKNDKRAGKAKIIGVPNGPEPVDVNTLASDLYKSNCTEIYVNDNRCEMFSIFPTYYNPALANKIDEEQDKKKKGKGKGKDKGKDKGGKNKSNAENFASSNVSANNFAKADQSLSSSLSSSSSESESESAQKKSTKDLNQRIHRQADLFDKTTATISPLLASRRYLAVVEETSHESLA